MASSCSTSLIRALVYGCVLSKDADKDDVAVPEFKPLAMTAQLPADLSVSVAPASGYYPGGPQYMP